MPIDVGGIGTVAPNCLISLANPMPLGVIPVGPDGGGSLFIPRPNDPVAAGLRVFSQALALKVDVGGLVLTLLCA